MRAVYWDGGLYAADIDGAYRWIAETAFGYLVGPVVAEYLVDVALEAHNAVFPPYPRPWA